MPDSLAPFALGAIALASGSVAYLCCRWMFLIARPLPTLLFWTYFFLLIYLRPHYLPFLMIYFIISVGPLMALSLFSLYFLMETSSGTSTSSKYIYAFATLYTTHVMAICFYDFMYQIRPIRQLAGWEASHSEVYYLLLVLISPPLTALVVWLKMQKHKRLSGLL